MKVQITVDEELWRAAKGKAALNGVTLGEFVGKALGVAIKSIKIQGDSFAETVTTEFEKPIGDPIMAKCSRCGDSGG